MLPVKNIVTIKIKYSMLKTTIYFDIKLYSNINLSDQSEYEIHAISHHVDIN